MIDCGRGAPSAFVEADLDFTRLEAVFISHLHVDHTGDLTGMLLYPWGVRARPDGRPLPPVRVYGPGSPDIAPAGDSGFCRETTIQPRRDPFPGVTDLVENILAGNAYHLNVMPLDVPMPDPGFLVHAVDLPISAPREGVPRERPSPCSATVSVRVTADPRHPRACPPRPRLSIRYPGRSHRVLWRHDRQRRPHRPRPGRRHPRPSGCGPRTTSRGHGLTGPDLERIRCRPM